MSKRHQLAHATDVPTGSSCATDNAMTTFTPTQRVELWFAARSWKIFPFQKAVWRAALAGRSGLLHATTGSGKTYAVWFAAVLRALREERQTMSRQGGIRGKQNTGLH